MLNSSIVSYRMLESCILYISLRLLTWSVRVRHMVVGLYRVSR